MEQIETGTEQNELVAAYPRTAILSRAIHERVTM